MTDPTRKEEYDDLKSKWNRAEYENNHLVQLCRAADFQEMAVKELEAEVKALQEKTYPNPAVRVLTPELIDLEADLQDAKDDLRHTRTRIERLKRGEQELQVASEPVAGLGEALVACQQISNEEMRCVRFWDKPVDGPALRQRCTEKGVKKTVDGWLCQKHSMLEPEVRLVLAQRADQLRAHFGILELPQSLSIEHFHQAIVQLQAYQKQVSNPQEYFMVDGYVLALQTIQNRLLILAASTQELIDWANKHVHPTGEGPTRPPLSSSTTLLSDEK